MKFQVRIFYSVRLFLGLISTFTDTVLVVALSRKYGKRLAWYTLAMLCLTSGCFFASTSEFLILSSVIFFAVNALFTSNFLLFLTNKCFPFYPCFVTTSSAEYFICFLSLWFASLTFVNASPGFLPSSFSMYAVTLSSALFLLQKYVVAVSVAAAGVIIGWPFSIPVFLPITFYSLSRGGFKKVFLSGLLTSVLILVRNLTIN